MSEKFKQKNIESENLEKTKCTSIRRKKGITLIALVITIVVLLILASVSITAVFGDNGLLKLAKEAGEKTNEAVKNDISSMGELEDILHETQTGIVVEKVTDTKPGELEQDEIEQNTYTINSIEDLVFFAYDVTNGNTYENKTVRLGLSLDFASTKSYVDANRTDYGEYGYNGELKKILNESGFIPIGIHEYLTDDEFAKRNEKNFHGIFDGNKNKIYNLKIKKIVKNANRASVGLFTSNLGTIQNLGIENASIDIEINAKGFSSGAILVAENGGTIRNCYTTGYINVTSNCSCNVGGLVGSNGDIVKECYNNAKVTIIRNGGYGYKAGGVLGTSSTKEGSIENIYNTGDIRCFSLKEYKSNINLAGICGFNDGAEINIGYNANTKIETDYSETRMAHITTTGNDIEATCTSCYYLPNKLYLNDEPVEDNSNTGTAADEAYMKSKEFVDELNRNNDNNNVWKQDTNNINNGYPILSWQQ